MGTEEFQQVILRRTLQAVVIGCTVVLFVILLTLIQSSLIWLPCEDGCPPRYDEFVQSLGYTPGYGATPNFFHIIFYTIVFNVSLVGFGIFRWIKFRLWSELHEWAATQDEQQRIALQAAVLQQVNQTVTISHDGELVELEAFDDDLPGASSGSPHKLNQPIFHPDAVTALADQGVSWFLSDVWLALHLAALTGCAIFVLTWWVGFPTDSWGAVGADWGLFTGLVPGIILGGILPQRYQNWRLRRSERASQLEDHLQILHVPVEDLLKQAGLNQTSLENLLGDSGKIDEVSDDPVNLEQDDKRHVYHEKRLNSLLHN